MFALSLCMTYSAVKAGSKTSGKLEVAGPRQHQLSL